MTPQQYFSTYYNSAKKASEQTGLPVLLILAQSALESGYGAHAPGNNFFGIKAGKSWNGEKRAVATHEYTNGVKTPVTDYFRVYSSPEDSFLDWANLLSNNKRYAKVISSDDTVSGARALGSSGYSTSPTYADSLIVVAHKLDPNAIPESTFAESLAKISAKSISSTIKANPIKTGLALVFLAGFAYFVTRAG